MRKAVFSLMTLAAALLMGSGVALAANVIACSGGVCNGTTGDDTMTGTSATDYLYADAGNDTLRGLGAFDDLRGGPGNDTMDGGGGNDQYNVYDVAWGVDRISGDSSGAEDWLIFQIPSGVTVDLIPSPNRDEVTSGANTINFASSVVIEWVQGGPESDTIKGNGARNYLSGAGGNDNLAGRKGNDRLLGDIVAFGNKGNDTLNGGPGRDVLEGGPGDDTFLAKDGEADTIDCGPGADRVTADPRLDTIDFDCIDFVAP